MKPEEGVYYIICPILENRMAVIGETGKFVTMSAKRFSSIRQENDRLYFEIEGVPGELVTIAIYAPNGIKSVKGTGASNGASSLSEDIDTFEVKIPESGRTLIELH